MKFVIRFWNDEYSTAVTQTTTTTAFTGYAAFLRQGICEEWVFNNLITRLVKKMSFIQWKLLAFYAIYS